MYTKGEWRVDGTSIVSDVLLLRVGDEVCPFLIAEVTSHIPLETKANAQLISAAPDLYEACKQAFNFCDDRVRFKISQALAKADNTVNKDGRNEKWPNKALE